MYDNKVHFLLVNLLLTSASGAEIPAKDRTVIVISLDGFPAAAWEDSRLPVPNLRRLISEGAQAKGMTPPNPSVTWPSHTTMITGVWPAEHGVLFNGTPLRVESKPVTIEPWQPKREMVLVETLYDRFHAAGMTAAQVDWVAIYNAPTIRWQFAEVPNAEGQIEREMIAAGTVTAADIGEFRKGNAAWRDQVWTQAALHILRTHKPNLLLFHLLNTDGINHNYGPTSSAANTGFALADFYVGRILNAVDKERTTLFVVSDHGFKTTKTLVRPNVKLREMGLLRGDGGAVECDVHVVPEGGTAMLYFTNAARKAALLPSVTQAMRETEGVANVVGPEDFPSMGFPLPANSKRMADLVLVAKNGYAFNGAHTGTLLADAKEVGSIGNHGYVNTDPEMSATFLAWGYGIRKGARTGVISSIDVAPTIAALSGVTLPRAKGRVVKEILAATPEK